VKVHHLYLGAALVAAALVGCSSGGGGGSTPAVSITTTALPDGVEGLPYGSVTLAASGGNGSFSWSATGLPAGLDVSSGGVITGSPAATGAAGKQVTVTVTSGSQTAQKVLNVFVGDVVFADSFEAGSGFTTTGQWELGAPGAGVPKPSSGSRMAGTSISNGSGYALSSVVETLTSPLISIPASGATVHAGMRFDVAFDIANGPESGLRVLVDDGGVKIPVTVAAHQLSLAYTNAVTPFSGDDGWYGDVPGGGAMTTVYADLSDFEGKDVRVVFEFFGSPASSRFGAVVDDLVVEAFSIVPGTMAAGEVGVAYSETITTDGASGAVTWEVLGGSPPASISFDRSNGTFSGTPTAVGEATILLRATDADGRYATRPVTIGVTDTIVMGSGSVNLTIPPVSTGNSGNAANDTTVSTITLPQGSGKVKNVVVTVDLTHGSLRNLSIFLRSPDDIAVTLVSSFSVSGGAAYTDTVFDDAASTLITAGSEPFTGTFKPMGSLSAQNGSNASGDWRLEIRDEAVGATGTLLDWSLTVEVE
jgi:subtilisin-like proprotein convertase family protein